MQKSFVLIAIAVVFLAGCNSIQNLKNSLKTPPYEKYVNSLEAAHLDKTILAKTWLRAGENALRDSVVVVLPFSESGYFKASEPAARSYRFHASEGQVLTAKGTVVARESTGLFLDLFVWENNAWTPISHGDSTFNLTFEFNRAYDQYMIRLQPELLSSVYYTFNVSLTPVLINPVSGANNKSIGSFYGDPRDGGKRKHEGVDIFAKKGTPVVAPSDGYVSRVGTSKLGGKYVWLTDSKRGHSYYFAHLDQQLVKAGTKVKQGEELGTVGNTGNAQYTPSHLHFGIYQSGSKDPIHYIRSMESLTEALPWDTTLTDPHYKVKVKRSFLRTGPSDKSQYLAPLHSDTYVKVIAHSSNWYRVSLPNQKQGFIKKTHVEALEKGKRHRLKTAQPLLSDTHEDSAPMLFLKAQSPVSILAYFQGFAYVKTNEGLTGWLMLPRKSKSS
jgi:murein DD-endopeptidase MepM/ murein hydrolase activator NlpD